MKNPLFMIVQRLLSKNKIVHDKKELAFQIQSHPSYPSLHAITGVLDHFNIENIAAEVPTDVQTLHQLPDTFIAQVNTDKGTDLVTASKVPNKPAYTIFSNAKKDEKISESEFLQRFTGIIVAVEKPEHQQANRDSSGITNITLLTVAAIITAVLLAPKIGSINIPYLILSIIGVIASYSILKQELGESTVIGEAFCSGNNDKKDCDAVLSSKGAELIKGHKLSDLSIIYFTGLTVASFITTSFNPLYIISFLALPITIYSIYYQYRIVKSWCTLCLTIVGVLWLQAGFAFLNTESIASLITINIESYLITVLSFLAVYIGWRYIKPLVKDVVDLKKEKIEFVKFKRNFNLFNTLLQKSPKLATKIEASKEIVLGNKDAALELVVITNPFCGHCRPVHKIIEEVLEKYNQLVKVTTRFNVPTDHPDSNGVVVANKLIELYNEEGQETCLKAMHEIYGDVDYDTWLAKWGKSKNFDNYLTVLTDEKTWCNNNGINFTPEILVNGRSFPKEYNRTDLIFFIEDLEENCKDIPQHSEL
ncbi:vitamin K epoxide reductase family protein [Tenacibaculum amylolyticum]|uniref:vitamin K epoxide reductase family protein n=1 Tax=Tenacibaculum amylolyticum TaxID=104269 RepID=UPI003896512A